MKTRWINIGTFRVRIRANYGHFYLQVINRKYY